MPLLCFHLPSFIHVWHSTVIFASLHVNTLARLWTDFLQNELAWCNNVELDEFHFISSAHLGRDLGRVLTNICFYVLILLCRHFTEFWAHRTLPWVSQIFLMRMWVQYLYAQDTSRWTLFGLPISKTSSFDFELKCEIYCSHITCCG